MTPIASMNGSGRHRSKPMTPNSTKASSPKWAGGWVSGPDAGHGVAFTGSVRGEESNSGRAAIAAGDFGIYPRLAQ